MLFVSAINMGIGVTDTEDNVTEFLNHGQIRKLRVPVAGVGYVNVESLGGRPVQMATGLAVPEVLPPPSSEALKLNLFVKTIRPTKFVTFYVINRLYACLEFALRNTPFSCEWSDRLIRQYLRPYTKIGDSQSDHLAFVVDCGHDARMKMQDNTDICSVSLYRIKAGTTGYNYKGCLLDETYFLRFGKSVDSSTLHPSVQFLSDNRSDVMGASFLKSEVGIELSKVMLSVYKFVMRNVTKISEFLKEIE